MNDREWLLAQQDDQQTERNAMAQIDHYQALGVSMAAFAVAMYTALMEDGTFSKGDALALVKEGVRGR